MMARLAEWRDDISGSIVTGGTSTAYTITSLEVFDSLAHMNGQMIAFTPHTTNGATVTLNVDGLGAKPLRPSPSVELQAGVLVQGTPYQATYNNSDAVWYLRGFFGNPYNIPLGGGLPFFGSTAPNSSFVFPYGQAVSRTTYASLFTLFSTTYGTGDGSTTFNVPDLRGRVVAGKDDMGGSTASRLTATYFGAASGQAGTILGAVGGNESRTLTAAQIPSITSSTNFGGFNVPVTASAITDDINATSTGSHIPTSPSTWAGISSATSTSTNTSGNAHPTVQPTIICNYIIRII